MTAADAIAREPCPGCKGLFAPHIGPTHRYMTSSAACWKAFGLVLAHEYTDPALLPTHRLSVDAYAVQHPGDDSRQAVQSVGLHLARLMLQLDDPRPPVETNAVMLRLGAHKHTLPKLTPPDGFTMTVAEVVPAAGSEDHARLVRQWASSAWTDWSIHHSHIRDWVRSTYSQ